MALNRIFPVNHRLQPQQEVAGQPGNRAAGPGAAARPDARPQAGADPGGAGPSDVIVAWDGGDDGELEIIDCAQPPKKREAGEPDESQRPRKRARREAHESGREDGPVAAAAGTVEYVNALVANAEMLGAEIANGRVEVNLRYRDRSNALLMAAVQGFVPESIELLIQQGAIDHDDKALAEAKNMLAGAVHPELEQSMRRIIRALEAGKAAREAPAVQAPALHPHAPAVPPNVAVHLAVPPAAANAQEFEDAIQNRDIDALERLLLAGPWPGEPKKLLENFSADIEMTWLARTLPELAVKHPRLLAAQERLFLTGLAWVCVRVNHLTAETSDWSTLQRYHALGVRMDFTAAELGMKAVVTPLHAAASACEPAYVALFIAGGLDVNAPDDDEVTPLEHVSHDPNWLIVATHAAAQGHGDDYKKNILEAFRARILHCVTLFSRAGANEASRAAFLRGCEGSEVENENCDGPAEPIGFWRDVAKRANAIFVQFPAPN